MESSGERGDPRGGPSVGCLILSAVTRFQEVPDQLEHALVGDSSCDAGHQRVVLDSIAETIQVQSDDILEPLGDVPLGALHRVVGRANRGGNRSFAPRSPGSKTGTSTCDMACWIKRSRVVGTLSSRSPSEGLGIVALRVGCDR